MSERPKTYVRGLLDAATIAAEMYQTGCSAANVASELRRKAGLEQTKVEAERANQQIRDGSK